MENKEELNKTFSEVLKELNNLIIEMKKNNIKCTVTDSIYAFNLYNYTNDNVRKN